MRFEVRYLKRVRDNVARNLRDRVEVIDLIEYARQDAARRLSRIMRVLQSMTGSSPFDREVLVVLLCAVHMATDGDEIATRRLLSPLINI